MLARMVEDEIENAGGGGGTPDGANSGEDREKKVAVDGHVTEVCTRDADGSGDASRGWGGRWVMKCLLEARDMVVKFGMFVGPGFMV